MDFVQKQKLIASLILMPALLLSRFISPKELLYLLHPTNAASHRSETKVWISLSSDCRIDMISSPNAAGRKTCQRQIGPPLNYNLIAIPALLRLFSATTFLNRSPHAIQSNFYRINFIGSIGISVVSLCEINPDRFVSQIATKHINLKGAQS
jgi:hypothetical protein